jgi:hypothetical protein
MTVIGTLATNRSEVACRPKADISAHNLLGLRSELYSKELSEVNW